MFLYLQRAFLVHSYSVLALCLLFLAGCSAPVCREWELQEIKTCTPSFNGGRLFLGPDTDCSRLELEIIRNASGIRFYINLLFLTAPPSQESPVRTRIMVQFETQDPQEFFPYLLEGGQRLLLPGDLADFLITNMMEGQSFTIQLGRSSITVVPDNFLKSYKELLAIPVCP